MATSFSLEAIGGKLLHFINQSVLSAVDIRVPFVTQPARMSKKYVLTGVGGGIGSVAADFAAENAQPDQKLLFTSRDISKLPAEKVASWKSKGVEVAEADYEDVDSLNKVFEGADTIAWISTWAIFHRPQQAANILEAAKASGVKRVCYTSFVGAGLGVDTEEGLRRDIRKELPFLPQDHALTERLIRESGLQFNIQRNYLYQDNTAAFFSQSWKFCGDKWFNNSAGAKGAYVAREDCGRVLGALLLGRQEPNTVVYVTGPEAVTDREVFEYMNSKSAYKAEFVDMSDEELRKWWADRGLPADALKALQCDLPLKLCQDDLLCCGQIVRGGFMAEVTDTVRRLTGREPLGFKENFVKYEGLFPKN